MSIDHTIPPPRVIVLCFDGTSNQFDDTNTNVVKFHSLLDKNCPLEQIVYYQPGIGTYINSAAFRPVTAALTWLAKKADQAFALFLRDHVKAGYKFLMQRYRPGDKICLFGFSRGAHTARALAGLLHMIGLLPRDNDDQIQFAYDLYENRKDKLAAGFKETFCTPVQVDFLGVWDTVASVGLLYGRDLPFTSANSAVRVFRHALSLDEHRARFQPQMFLHETPEEAAKRKNDPGTSSNSEALSSGAPPSVMEVWFAGCHSDVGGGAVTDEETHTLANISLRWMVKEVGRSKCGIKFDETALKKANIEKTDLPGPAPRTAEQLRTDYEAEIASSSPEGGGGVIEKAVLAEPHDELDFKLSGYWLGYKFLEYFPVAYMHEADGRKGPEPRRINRGHGRKIGGDHPLFHKSVWQRMTADPKYQPKAEWAKGEERYVD